MKGCKRHARSPFLNCPDCIEATNGTPPDITNFEAADDQLRGLVARVNELAAEQRNRFIFGSATAEHLSAIESANNRLRRAVEFLEKVAGK